MTPDTIHDVRPRAGSMLPAAAIGFTFVGLATAIIGPLLPAMSGAWSLDDTQSGALFAARSLGCLAGVGVIGALARRMPIGRVLAVGFAMTGLGSLCTATSTWGLGVGAIFFTGIGLTVATAGTNLYIATSRT